jgi:hypothetical protein
MMVADTKTGTASPLVSDLMRYEAGEMDEGEVVTMFQYLINSGMAWKLQGVYGIIATKFIEVSLCDPAPDAGTGEGE